jgi:hypothetical protein
MKKKEDEEEVAEEEEEKEKKGTIYMFPLLWKYWTQIIFLFNYGGKNMTSNYSDFPKGQS